MSIWTLAALAVWIAAVLPTIAGVIEYGGRTFWEFADAYPGLFLFPVLLFPVAVWGFKRPMLLLLRLPHPNIARARLVALAALSIGAAAGAAVGLAAEALTDHWVPWEVAPSVSFSPLESFESGAATKLWIGYPPEWSRDHRWPQLLAYLRDTQSLLDATKPDEEKTLFAELARERRSNQRLFATFFSKDGTAARSFRMSKVGRLRFVSIALVTALGVSELALAILLAFVRLRGFDSWDMRTGFAHITAALVVFWAWLPLRMVTTQTNWALYGEGISGREGAVALALCVGSAAVLVFWLAKSRDTLLAVLTLCTTASGLLAYYFRDSLGNTLQDPVFYLGMTVVMGLVGLGILYYHNLDGARVSTELEINEPPDKTG